MTSKAQALTDKQILGAKPKANKYELVDSTRQRGAGRLVVRITPKGKKEFCFKYTFEGVRRYISIGIYPTMSLVDAREEIRPHSSVLAQGIDPKVKIEKDKAKQNAAEQAEAMKGSIQQLFRAYTAQMKEDGKRTYGAVLKALEKEVYPHIPAITKAKEVQPTDIVPILSSMIKRGAVVQSNRVRSYIVAAYNFGLRHDLNPAQAHTGVKFGLLMNPAQVVAKQSHAEKVGENWLTLNEVQELLANFHRVNRIGPMVSALMGLCFYTGGQRPYELVASRWESVNWKEKTLLVTAEVSKNKRPHLIPLTDSAFTLLRNLQDESESGPFIFPRKNDHQQHLRTDSFSKAISRYREAYPESKAFVARDIRRTCKTLMGELGISKELRDRLQNHALNDVSSKHYDRYSYLPEKREALRKWEARLTGIEGTIIEGNFGGIKHA
ncbi:site-specific integrase [Shewanella sp. 6_MG-2023]|uniref:tyrosine-type recombinase/integrase n=1 Tax=Shewanella sp. 6_MG-2023 TaxID=3062660 RepID=UPI0026E43E9A|nr:site-specific integrase [Shewanella sp. 6_MG-2023]MDO6617437.1 tyrosine-type recombinase/integrase [Shewanella sp. 6_MG-2023]